MMIYLKSGLFPIAIFVVALGMRQLAKVQPNVFWLDAVPILAAAVLVFQLGLFAITRLKTWLIRQDDILWVDHMITRLRAPCAFLAITSLALAADGLRVDWFGQAKLEHVNVIRILCSRTSSTAVRASIETPTLNGRLCFRPVDLSPQFGVRDWHVPSELLTSPLELGQHAMLTVRYFSSWSGGNRAYFEIVNVD